MLGLIPAGPCGGCLMLGLANPRVCFESGVLWVAVHDPVVMTLSTSSLAAAMAVKWRFPRGRGPAQMFSRAGTFPARTFSDPRRKTSALENTRWKGRTSKNKGKRTRVGKRPRWKTPAQEPRPRWKTPAQEPHPRWKTPAQEPHPRGKTPAQDTTRARNTTLQQPRSRERSDAKPPSESCTEQPPETTWDVLTVAQARGGPRFQFFYY